MDDFQKERLNECLKKTNPHLIVDEDFQEDTSRLYQIASGIKEKNPKDTCLAVAYQWFEIAYQKGHLLSGVVMSEMLIKGEGTQKDTDKGLWVLKNLAKNKSAEAHYHLAYLAYQGFLKRDSKFIKKHLKKAIKLDHSDAVDLSIEFNKLIKAKDYLSEKDYQSFKNQVQMRITLPDFFFSTMTSKKESYEYLLHLDAALNHDQKSIEILHQLHKNAQKAQQFWFHRYLEALLNFIRMNKAPQKNNLTPTTLKTPYALDLEDVQVKNFEPHSHFPIKIPLLMQSHLLDHQQAYQSLKNTLANRFHNKPIYLSHSLLAKATVRKLLYHVSKIYDLNHKPIENHPTELIHDLFRYVIKTINLYHGDITVHSGDQSYFLTLLNQGDTFDRVPSMAKTLHYFSHQLKLSQSMIEAYQHLNMPHPFNDDVDIQLFFHLDQWCIDNQMRKETKAILLCIVGLHTSLKFAALEKDLSFDKKAEIHVQFYQTIYTLMSRFYGVFKKDSLSQVTEKFWHTDLQNGFIQKNELAILFENYEEDFDIYEEEPFFFFESQEFEEDEDDEIILLT